MYLVDKGILKQPILYLSDFFQRNRNLYYDNLMRVRTHNDLKQWLKFFLVGVIETAANGVSTFDDILKLKQRTEMDIVQLGARSSRALQVLQYLLKNPMVDAAKIQKITGVSNRTAYHLIEDLVKIGTLKEITGAKRDKIFAFESYLELFR